MDYKEKKLSEPARQFEEIFEDYHNPIRKMERIIKNRRKKRQENKQKDVGL